MWAGIMAITAVVVSMEASAQQASDRDFEAEIEPALASAKSAASSGATVLLSNHSEFDNAVNRNRMLAGRGDGPHPYELGEDWVQRYFQVMQSCARAAQLRLEQQLAKAAVL